MGSLVILPKMGAEAGEGKEEEEEEEGRRLSGTC